MSSSPSSRRNRSTEFSNRKTSVRERHNNSNDFSDKEEGSEFNTRGQGPPKIEGMVSLKVDNITQRTGVNLLKKVFGKYGDLGDIYVPRYPDTFASRGFAFVRYFRKRDAEEAMHAMNGERLDGRILSIQMARYARPNSKSDKDRHLSSKRTHYSDYRRNGVNRSFRRSDYNDRSFSRRNRSRSRSRSRDRRKPYVRHGRSRSRSRSRSKGRSSRRRTRRRSRSKSKTKSRSRSQSRNSSKSLSQEKKKFGNNSEKDSNSKEEKNTNSTDVKSEEVREKSDTETNHRKSRSRSNSR